MIPIPHELLKDPLFQLNVLLWLAQPLPDGNEITPLFYAKGFMVYAVALLVGPPPDLRLMAQEARISMQDRVRPDVVLALRSNHKFGFAECKKSSFGPTSSTAEQARSLLVVAGPRAAEVLGLDSGRVADSLLAFVIPENDREPLARTLANLHEELREKRLPAGRFSVLGLMLTDTELSLVTDDPGSEFVMLELK